MDSYSCSSLRPSQLRPPAVNDHPYILRGDEKSTNQQASRYRESSRLHRHALCRSGKPFALCEGLVRQRIQTIYCHGFPMPRQDQVGLLRGEYDMDLTARRKPIGRLSGDLEVDVELLFSLSIATGFRYRSRARSNTKGTCPREMVRREHSFPSLSLKPSRARNRNP